MSTRVYAWIAVALWAGVIFVGSAQPGSRIPGRFSQVGHFGEYAILGGLLAIALIASRPWRGVVLAVLLASLYGVSDELHQSFVPGRTPDPADWALDTVGALVGALAALWLLTRLGRRRSQAAMPGGSEPSSDQ